MKEAIKGVIFNQGKVKLDNKKVHKYLVAMVLVTDSPIDGIDETQETVILSEEPTNQLTEFLSNTQKYQFKVGLGDIETAILTVANMSLEDIKSNANLI